MPWFDIRSQSTTTILQNRRMMMPEHLPKPSSKASTQHRKSSILGPSLIVDCHEIANIETSRKLPLFQALAHFAEPPSAIADVPVPTCICLKLLLFPMLHPMLSVSSTWSTLLFPRTHQPPRVSRRPRGL